MANPSFSIFSQGRKYTGDEPFFYNPQDFNWVKAVEENSQIIIKELTDFISPGSVEMKPYFHRSLISKGNWKTFSFFFWNMRVSDGYKTFPETIRILKNIPGILSASISMLEPNTAIEPHQGDTNAIIRCHLGLIIPGKLPDCGMKVGTETQSWENGKVMLFCDAHEHSAFNNTDKKRYVLLFDVLKPEYSKMKMKVCSGALAQLSIFYLASIILKPGPSISIKVPRWVTAFVHNSFSILFVFIIPVKNSIENFKQKMNELFAGKSLSRSDDEKK